MCQNPHCLAMLVTVSVLGSAFWRRRRQTVDFDESRTKFEDRRQGNLTLFLISAPDFRG
jgi:hypothetical protein